MKTNNPAPKKEKQVSEERLTYETPAIIHEGTISTRAGSPIDGAGDDPGIDPADLFGR
jgi:hypothetical protein